MRLKKHAVRFLAPVFGISSLVWTSCAEVFPAGTTPVISPITYDSGEELALTNEEGSVLEVKDGGGIVYKADKVESRTAPVFTVAGGSELKIEDDAYVVFSNFAGNVSFAGTVAQTAKVTVAGGSLTFDATRVDPAAEMHMLGKISFGEYSRTEVSGDGVIDFNVMAAGKNSPRFSVFTVDGGELYFRDDAEMRFGTAVQSSPVVRRGYVEFSGSSVLNFLGGKADAVALSGLLISCDGDPGDSVTVRFKDHARTETSGKFNLPYSVRLGSSKPGTWSKLFLNSDGVVSLGVCSVIGISHYGEQSSTMAGGALLEITDGYAQTGGNFGLIVGHVDGLGSMCTGIVHVAGGGFMSRAGMAYNSNAFCGTLIGRGPAIVDDNVYSFGALEVSGGAFTNQTGHFVVGTGRSFGRVVQSGGEIRSTPSHRRPLVIGFAGGNGLYAVSNGHSHVLGNVYVGGADPADFDLSASANFRSATSDGTSYKEDYTLSGAVGRLTVAAADQARECLFETGYHTAIKDASVFVGKNGTGEIEIGEGGAIICFGMTLCGPSATLRFTLGPDGRHCDSAPAFLRVKKYGGSDDAGSGLLKICEGAKLVVDVRGYTGRNRWVQLIKPFAREGEFAPENIRVIGGGEVVHDRPGYDGIWVRIRRGFTMIVR